MTILAQLVASNTDPCGYTTYVFKRLDGLIEGSAYMMCVRYPNWQERSIKLGEKGYVSVMEVKAGIDKWYDGTNMVPYKYDCVQFLKFIELPETLDQEYVM